jgi:hypothetical protein
VLAWAAGLAPAAAEVLVCAAGRTLGDAAPDPASPAIRPAEG